eukprot:g2249.t1
MISFLSSNFGLADNKSSQKKFTSEGWNKDKGGNVLERPGVPVWPTLTKDDKDADIAHFKEQNPLSVTTPQFDSQNSQETLSVVRAATSIVKLYDSLKITLENAEKIKPLLHRCEKEYNHLEKEITFLKQRGEQKNDNNNKQSSIDTCDQNYRAFLAIPDIADHFEKKNENVNLTGSESNKCSPIAPLVLQHSSTGSGSVLQRVCIAKQQYSNNNFSSDIAIVRSTFQSLKTHFRNCKSAGEFIDIVKDFIQSEYHNDFIIPLQSAEQQNNESWTRSTPPLLQPLSATLKQDRKDTQRDMFLLNGELLSLAHLKKTSTSSTVPVSGEKQQMMATSSSFVESKHLLSLLVKKLTRDIEMQYEDSYAFPLPQSKLPSLAQTIPVRNQNDDDDDDKSESNHSYKSESNHSSYIRQFVHKIFHIASRTTSGGEAFNLLASLVSPPEQFDGNVVPSTTSGIHDEMSPAAGRREDDSFFEPLLVPMAKETEPIAINTCMTTVDILQSSAIARSDNDSTSTQTSGKITEKNDDLICQVWGVQATIASPLRYSVMSGGTTELRALATVDAVYHRTIFLPLPPPKAPRSTKSQKTDYYDIRTDIYANEGRVQLHFMLPHDTTRT